jgi:hypothetical protein
MCDRGGGSWSGGCIIEPFIPLLKFLKLSFVMPPFDGLIDVSI